MFSRRLPLTIYPFEISEPPNTPMARPQARRNLMLATFLCMTCLVGLICVFVAAQTLALKFTSDNHIIKNLKTSVDMELLTILNPISPYGHSGHNYDTATECLALSVNLGNKQEPLLTRLATTPTVLNGINGVFEPCAIFIEGLQHGGLYPQVPYIRYWWGAEIYLRPLLNFITLDKVHRWNAIFLIAAASFLAVRINKSFGFLAVLAFLLPLVWASNILTTSAVTVHALTWIWALASLGGMMCWFKNHDSFEPATIALVFSLGCVANFFDVLFSPPYAPTFIAFLSIAFALGRLPSRVAVIDAMILVISWFGGFSLTWISKWLFAVSVFPWDTMIAEITDRVKMRSFPQPSLAGFFHGLFDASQTALGHADPDMIGMAWIAAFSIIVLKMCRSRARYHVLMTFLTLLTPLLIPIVWVEALHVHTLQHPDFAARAFTFFATLPLLAALLVARMNKNPETKSEKMSFVA